MLNQNQKATPAYKGARFDTNGNCLTHIDVRLCRLTSNGQYKIVRKTCYECAIAALMNEAANNNQGHDREQSKRCEPKPPSSSPISPKKDRLQYGDNQARTRRRGRTLSPPRRSKGALKPPLSNKSHIIPKISKTNDALIEELLHIKLPFSKKVSKGSASHSSTTRSSLKEKRNYPSAIKFPNPNYLSAIKNNAVNLDQGVSRAQTTAQGIGHCQIHREVALSIRRTTMPNGQWHINRDVCPICFPSDDTNSNESSLISSLSSGDSTKKLKQIDVTSPNTPRSVLSLNSNKYYTSSPVSIVEYNNNTMGVGNEKCTSASPVVSQKKTDKKIRWKVFPNSNYSRSSSRQNIHCEPIQEAMSQDRCESTTLSDGPYLPSHLQHQHSQERMERQKSSIQSTDSESDILDSSCSSSRSILKTDLESAVSSDVSSRELELSTGISRQSTHQPQVGWGRPPSARNSPIINDIQQVPSTDIRDSISSRSERRYTREPSCEFVHSNHQGLMMQDPIIHSADTEGQNNHRPRSFHGSKPTSPPQDGGDNRPRNFHAGNPPSPRGAAWLTAEMRKCHSSSDLHRSPTMRPRNVPLPPPPPRRKNSNDSCLLQRSNSSCGPSPVLQRQGSSGSEMCGRSTPTFQQQRHQQYEDSARSVCTETSELSSPEGPAPIYPATARSHGLTSVVNLLYSDRLGGPGLYSGELDQWGRPHGHGKMKYDNGSKKYEGEWMNGVPNAADFAQQNMPKGIGGFGLPPPMPGGMSVVGGAASVVHNGNATVMGAPIMGQMAPMPHPYGPNIQYGRPNTYGGFVPPTTMGQQGMHQHGMMPQGGMHGMPPLHQHQPMMNNQHVMMPQGGMHGMPTLQQHHNQQGMMPQGGMYGMPPSQQHQPMMNNFQTHPSMMVQQQSTGTANVPAAAPGEEQTLPMKSPAPGGSF